MGINAGQKMMGRVFSLILLSSSVSLGSDDSATNNLSQLFSNFSSISSISSQKASSDYELSWSYVPPSVESVTQETLDFFSAMFADTESVRRNFNAAYLEDLNRRVGENAANLPKIFLKDAQSRGLHYVFVTDQKTNVCFGYFSFRPYDPKAIKEDHPLFSDLKKLSAQNKPMWNVGVFFLKDYRQNGVLSSISDRFMDTLGEGSGNLEGMTFCSDTDHPLVHSFISKHPEWKWRGYNEKPFEGKYYYIHQADS